MNEFQRILIPTDGSEANDRAINKGLKLARMVGAKVKILFVVDTSTFTEIPPDELISTLKGHMKAKGDEIVEEIEEKADEMGVEVEKSILHGKPAEEIISESEDMDLIVMGTHGRSGLSRLFVGSTAQKVLKEAKCPIMLVRIEEE